MSGESNDAFVALDRRLAGDVSEGLDGRRRGAALFADLAGFTPLTTALVQALGPRAGAEELTRHLDATYGALVEQVHRHAGTVIDFSGDAILCWFDDKPFGFAPPSPSGLDRALSSASDQQRVIARLEAIDLPGGQRFELSLKVGVAAGLVERFAIGDPQERLVDVIAGPPVDMAVQAERLAQPGEVILDPHGVDQTIDGELRQAAGRTVLVVRKHLLATAGLPWPSPPNSTVAADAWLDYRLRDGRALATELRSTVALFVRFPALTDIARLDRFVRTAQRVVARGGGLIIQVTLGDKGGYLYVAFGAHAAHDDLVDRAMATALELREPSTVGTPLAMGIAHGLARTGAYGGRDRRTYGALGDAVNLAAALMSAAKDGAILVTPAARQASRHRFRFGEVQRVALKGNAGGAEVVELVGRMAGIAPRRFGPMVGRSRELASLVAAVERVAHGPAGTIVINGEAGIGKSHLVEAARCCLLDGLNLGWLNVEGADLDGGSIGGFTPLLRDVFFQDLAGDDGVRRSLFDLGLDALAEQCTSSSHPEAAGLANALRRDASYLAALLGLRWVGSPYEQHDPRTREGRCTIAVDDLLRAQSLQRPLAIHIADAHRLGLVARTLVERLVLSGRRFPMCIVIEMRPLDSGQTDEAHLDGADRILLEPLDLGEVATLMETTLGAPVENDLSSLVAQRTGGNPFFVEQLCLDMRQRRAVTITAGAYRLVYPDRPQDGVPLTLNGALVSRLDSLDTSCRDVALAAAVLGPVFDTVVLCRLLRAEGAKGHRALEGVLADGEAARLWRHLDQGAYEFCHRLVRDAAYAMQLDERLVARHRGVARILRRLPTPRTPGRLVEIAEHERRGGRYLAAAAMARRSARDSASAHDLRVAHQQFRLALQDAHAAGVGEATQARLEEATAGVALGVGAYEDAANHAVQGRVLAGLSEARRVALAAIEGEALARLGRASQAEAAFERAIEGLAAAPEPALASRVYCGLAAVRAHLGMLDEALDLATLALALAGDDHRAAGEAHRGLTVVEERRGNHAASLVHNDAARARYEACGDAGGLAAVENNTGVTLLAIGDLGGAVAALQRAVAAFEICGREHGLACALDNLAGALDRAGRTVEAEACTERAVTILARIGMDSGSAHKALWQGGCW